MDTILDEGMDTLDMDTRGVIHPHTHAHAGGKARDCQASDLNDPNSKFIRSVLAANSR